jgi:hypothetical protein
VDAKRNAALSVNPVQVLSFSAVPPVSRSTERQPTETRTAFLGILFLRIE